MKLIFVSNDKLRRQACRQALHELQPALRVALAIVTREANFDPLDLKGADQARAWAEANLRNTHRLLSSPIPCLTICVVQEGLGEYLCIGGSTTHGIMYFEENHSNDGPSEPNPVIEGLKKVIWQLASDGDMLHVPS